ncbi:hypothetical protein L0F63_007502, partial [Massospora cicadina]
MSFRLSLVDSKLLDSVVEFKIRQHSASLLFVNILTSAAVCWNWFLSLVDSHVAHGLSAVFLKSGLEVWWISCVLMTTA